MPVTPMPIGVNLLPWRANRARRRRRVFGSALITLLTLGLAVMWAASLAIEPAYERQATANAKLRAQLATLSERVTEYRDLEQRSQTHAQRRNALKAIRQKPIRLLKALAAATQAMPTAAVLTRLKQTPEALIVSGHTPTPEAVPRLLNRLRQHPAFANAILKSLQPLEADSATNRQFTLQAYYHHEQP